MILKKFRGGLVMILFLLGLFIGCMLGAIIMSCLVAGKNDDITSGRE